MCRPGLQLVDSALPLLVEDSPGRRAVVSPQRLEDLLVGQGGEGDTGRVAEVGGEVPPQDLAEAGNELEEAAIGAAAEEDPVPFILEIGAARGVSPDMLELPVDLSEPLQPLSGEVGCQLEGEGLEGAEDPADFADFARIEWRNPEAATHIGIEYSLPGQAEQRFANRGSADSQACGEIGVSHSTTRRGVAPMNRIEELSVDLVSEWCALELWHVGSSARWQISN